MKLEQWIEAEVRAARGTKPGFVQRVLKMDLKSQLMLVGFGIFVVIIFWPIIKLVPLVIRFSVDLIATLLRGGTAAVTPHQLDMLTVGTIFGVMVFLIIGFQKLLRGWVRGQRVGEAGKIRKILKDIRAALPESSQPRPEELAEAARQLRLFSPMDAAAVQDNAQASWLRLLVWSHAVDEIRGKLVKMVSIKSIEQDREAGWDEE